MNFTLIIPHFNIPSLLERCLKSIPIRPDLQVVVVDDASSAEVVDQLKFMECNFPNVDFIYSMRGRGGGAARNIGLDAAKGKYVFFADADDFFTPCLNQILDDVLKIGKDFFCFNAISVDTDLYTFTYRCWHLNRLIKMYKTNPSKAEFELRYAFGEPWCKVIRRSVIESNQIRFDETRIHNDTRFSYLVGHYAETIEIDQRAIYCVTDRIGSVSKVLTPERLIARAKVFADANKFFRDNDVRRFDERAIRPLVKFLAKADLKNFCNCKRVLEESGMGFFTILVKLVMYPLYAFHKALISASQYKMRLLG